jgi:hypothetical protein
MLLHILQGVKDRIPAQTWSESFKPNDGIILMVCKDYDGLFVA